MTLRVQPCRIPLVARHQSPSAPAKRNACLSWRYMAARARRTPSSMPSSRAICKTTASGMRSKHLTWSRLNPSRRQPLSRASSRCSVD